MSKQKTKQVSEEKNPIVLDLPINIPLTELYMDAQDVMQAFHISVRTLQSWRTNKKIAHTRIGGRILYPRIAILKKLQERTVGM